MTARIIDVRQDPPIDKKRDDADLIQAVVAGDPLAFTPLVHRYFGLIYSIALAGLGQREAAEDLTQETFVRAYLGLVQLKKPSAFAAWLCQIARNMATDWQRRGQHGSTFLPLINKDESSREIPDGRLIPADRQMEIEESKGAIHEAIARLPREQREVILLYYMEELGQCEIARMLGYSQAKISRLLKLALGAMRIALEERTRQELGQMRAQPQAKACTMSLIGAVAALPLAAKASLASASATALQVLTASASTPIGGGLIGGKIGLCLKAIKLFYTTGGKTMLAMKSLATLLGVMTVAAVIGVNADLAKAQNANREEALKILDAYTKTQDAMRSFIIRFEGDVDSDCQLPPPYDVHDGKSVRYASGETRWDGRRCSVRSSEWGELFGPGNLIPKDDASYNSRLFDGNRYVFYSCRLKVDPSRPTPMGTGNIKTRPDGVDDYQLYTESSEANLRGYFHDERQRVDAILREAEDIRMHRELDASGAPGLYVIEGQTTWGARKIWLDPAHDYHIARAEFHKTGGDYFGGGKPFPEGFTADYTLNITQFDKIGDRWLPMEATWTFDRKHPTGHYVKQDGHIKRTGVILSPDFDALHAFEPDDVRDGADFHVDVTPEQRNPARYLWQKGELIPQASKSSAQ